MSAPPVPAGSLPAANGRGVTLVLPGPISYDGCAYRIFKPYGQLASSLCGHFGSVTVCGHVLRPGHPGFRTDDPLLDPRVRVEPLPTPPSGSAKMLPALWHHLHSAVRVVRRIRRWDVVYAFIPSYQGGVAYTVNHFFHRRPAAVYLANDWEEIAPYTFRWGGVRGLLFRPYRFLLTRWEAWMMRTTRLGLTAGRALLGKYGGGGRPVYETAPILEMKPPDMVRRDDTCAAGPVRLLYVGGLNRRKGVPVLLEALQELRREGREVTLDIVGEGPERAALAVQAARHGLGGHVAFHGFVAPGAGLFGFYRRADIFVLPTYSEGFPRVIYEAMGHSLPVVASAVSGIPFLLRDGHEALLVPPGDARALAGSLRRVMDDGELRRSLIREGFALVGPIMARDPAAQFAQLFREHLSGAE
ncbi:MAG TPA: glycosyltransferase family 4 protein [Longimicrobium sp.]